MANMHEHEAMDLVLKFLIENPDNKRNDGYFHNTKIKEILFNEQDTEVVNFILKKIIDAGGNIVKTQIREDSVYHLDAFFKATVFTSIFLVNQGGFTALYEKNKTEQKENLRLEDVKNRKLESDAKLSEWQVKTFWWIFVFGVFGFMFGVYNFINNLRTAKNIELQKQTNQRMESELSKLRTLVLEHETVDSIYNSKTQIDSLMLE